MAEIKFQLGTVIRLTSFANKFADGSEPKGVSASPEGTPDENKKVFVCMLLGLQPMLDEEYTPEKEEQLVRKALRSLGYYRVEDMVALPGTEMPRG